MADPTLLIHVAFADDHIVIRQGIVSLVEALGNIQVDIQADNGAEMLSKLEAADRLPDICIIDINMPVMDGYMLLLELKKRWPDMRTLIFTAFDNEPGIIRMIKAGANGYLLKNCRPDDLKDALFAIHHTGYYYSVSAGSDMFQRAEKPVRQLKLTNGEIELLKRSCSELSYSQIATQMQTTIKSVEGYRDRLFSKLNVNSRAGLILYAIKSGIVPLEPNYAIKSNPFNNKK